MFCEPTTDVEVIMMEEMFSKQQEEKLAEMTLYCPHLPHGTSKVSNTFSTRKQNWKLKRNKFLLQKDSSPFQC